MPWRPAVARRLHLFPRRKSLIGEEHAGSRKVIRTDRAHREREDRASSMARARNNVAFPRVSFIGLGATAALAVAAPSSAATVITAFNGGPFAPGSVANFTALTVQPSQAGDTFDFTFMLSGGPANVLTQIQASLPSGSETFSFGLYSGMPPSGAFLGTSSDITGPSLYKPGLASGSYYLQTTSSPAVGSLVSGALDVAAAVPEPAAWIILIAGFAFVGYAVRRRRVSVSAS
ncbi:MAG: PEPxxWA-CTERM sorting domain-containing protein [Caulobacteraceae bacterium]